MKLVYIAGPYRDARGEAFVFENIMVARDAATLIWSFGAAAICPHLNTFLMGGLQDDGVWLIGDLEILKRCDAVYVIGDHQESSGTQGEITHAHINYVPVFYSPVCLRKFIDGMPE